MYDILNNHRIEIVRSVAANSIGAANLPDDDGFDLWENTQLPNCALIIVDVTSVGTSGTLDLIVQDSEDDTTFDADFITVDQITATGLYFIDVNDPERYLRLNATVATDSVTWGAYIMTFEDQRRPVTQSGTTCDLTYGTLRSPKVATS